MDEHIKIPDDLKRIAEFCDDNNIVWSSLKELREISRIHSLVDLTLADLENISIEELEEMDKRVILQEELNDLAEDYTKQARGGGNKG